MVAFPHSEAEILDLCDQIIAGLDTYGTSFPSVTPAALLDLQSAKTTIDGMRVDQEAKKTIAKVATAGKNTAMDGLADKMKKVLKLAEFDCAQTPEQLGYIGWGPRTEASSQTVVPVQPTYLKITAEGPADIWLAWEHPSRLSVRHWLIERRQQVAPGGAYTDWALAGTSLNPEAHLEGQPTAAKLEYRVKAENAIGPSEPSNSVFAVL